MYRLASVVLVLVAAALFAYVIAPLVRGWREPSAWQAADSSPRSAAIAVIYLALAGSVAAGAVVLLPVASQQVTEMVSGAPASTQSFLAWEHGWSRYYERLRIPIPLRQSIDQAALAAGTASVEATRQSLLSLARGLSNLPWLILVPILAFFLLKDATTIRRTIVRGLPHRFQLRGHRLFEDLNATLAAYSPRATARVPPGRRAVRLGFGLLGVPYPVPLRCWRACSSHSAGRAAATRGTRGRHRRTARADAGRIDDRLSRRAPDRPDYAIYPRLIRRGSPLHPLAVIVAVLAGAELGGTAGMFLAVPAAAIATVVVRHAVGWRAEAVPSGTAESA